MKDRFQIAICEDNQSDAKLLMQMLENMNTNMNIEMICDVYESAECLLACPKLGEYDLLMLDIYLEGMTGVSLAQEIRKNNLKCEIIFISSSTAHALEGFGVSALDYIIKPITFDAVQKAVLRFAKIYSEKEIGVITIAVERRPVRILYSDIMYIESDDKYCIIHCTDGVHRTYSSLKQLLDKLPQSLFLQCHRMFVVNLDQVKEQSDDFYMRDGQRVLIHRRNYENVKKVYTKYQAEKARREMYAKDQ